MILFFRCNPQKLSIIKKQDKNEIWAKNISC